MFRTLERPQFAAVQGKLFPIYFSIQTGAPVVLALTLPGSSSAMLGPASGFAGVLDPENRWTVLAPLAVMLISGAVNLGVLLPVVNDCMERRRLQGT